MAVVLFSAFLAFCITFITIPIVINVAELKRLYDEPSFRKAHKSNVPNLGGLVIFASIFFTTCLLVDFSAFAGYNYVLAALTILFFIGLKDDILVIAFTWKLLGQVFAALIVVMLGDIRLTSFYGVFGIHSVSYPISVIASVFLVILIINSFNFIDGIDCLAATIGILILIVLGTWFVINKEYPLAVISFSLGASLLGFIFYNYPPARIFMGDTGAYTIGILLSVLIIRFIELNGSGTMQYSIYSFPAFAFALLIIPLFDTLRVFFVRLFRNRSPFRPDKNHLHHNIVALGLTHVQATMILVIINVFFIALAFTLQYYRLKVNYMMIIVFVAASILSQVPYLLKRKRIKRLRAA